MWITNTFQEDIVLMVFENWACMLFCLGKQGLLLTICTYGMYFRVTITSGILLSFDIIISMYQVSSRYRYFFLRIKYWPKTEPMKMLRLGFDNSTVIFLIAVTFKNQNIFYFLFPYCELSDPVDPILISKRPII